jgi:hypothetical protein
MKKSVQELIDDQMCRPGYRWNDTLKRCLGMGGGDGEIAPPAESIAPEVAAPAKPAKGGRGAVRVNTNGVKQMGTSMGKSIAIK